MKKIFTLFFLSLLASGVFAQMDFTIDFEAGLTDTSWTSFANGSLDTITPDIEIVANPLMDDVNDSDSVLAFNVGEDADRWCGAYRDYDIFLVFGDTTHTLAMMVNKSVISPVKLKVEKSETGGEDLTIEAVNTVTDQWELLTYDFSDVIGHYYGRLTFFPDFPASNDDKTWGAHTVYIDNIGVPMEEENSSTYVDESSGKKMWLYPTPAEYRMAVSYPGMTSITVYDIMGKQIRSMTFAPVDSKVIETGDLHTGIYFLTAVSGNDRITMKFMKK